VFNIDYISYYNLFLENSLIDAGIQTQLFRALDRFETNDDMRNGLAITTQWILCLCWRQFRDFSLVDSLSLLF
jgi:hypothetical protein